jgi:uncharacterized protein (TIGR02996 family)
MVTEDDFQSALDRSRTDCQTLLVFADWLQDRGDPRADGYRALGLWRRRPVAYTRNGYLARTYTRQTRWSWWTPLAGIGTFGGCLVDGDLWTCWFQRLRAGPVVKPVSGLHSMYDKTYPARRTADEYAVDAFARLSPFERRWILAGPDGPYRSVVYMVADENPRQFGHMTITINPEEP